MAMTEVIWPFLCDKACKSAAMARQISVQVIFASESLRTQNMPPKRGICLYVWLQYNNLSGSYVYVSREVFFLAVTLTDILPT